MSFADDFEAFIIEEYEYICSELYRTLEKEYDYFTSDEQIAEALRDNDYDFTEGGNIY
jgi:hypothetical protein